MNALPVKESIEELLEKENPEQTEKEKTEALQELEIYLCKTALGRKIWKKKEREKNQKICYELKRLVLYHTYFRLDVK
jgi:hypothetical protein